MHKSMTSVIMTRFVSITLLKLEHNNNSNEYQCRIHEIRVFGQRSETRGWHNHHTYKQRLCTGITEVRVSILFRAEFFRCSFHHCIIRSFLRSLLLAVDFPLCCRKITSYHKLLCLDFYSKPHKGQEWPPLSLTNPDIYLETFWNCCKYSQLQWSHHPSEQWIENFAFRAGQFN